MVWIALNIKATNRVYSKYDRPGAPWVKLHLVEDAKENPKLNKLGHDTVPTLSHAGTVYNGSAECLKYISYKIGKRTTFTPKDPKAK